MTRVLNTILAAGLLCFFPMSAYAEVRYTGKGLRDPFLDPAVITTPQDDTERVEKMVRTLTLEGLFVGSGSPRAIINGQLYDEGSALEGSTKIKVARIEKDGVVLDVKGKEYPLKQNLRKTS